MKFRKYKKEEKSIWDHIYSESQPLDVRNLNLTVEPGFDECLKKFGENTNKILDFGCGKRKER